MTTRRGGFLPWSSDLSHGYGAVVAVCQEEASRCVTKALGSNDLREIVRLTAEASILESIGRKLQAGIKVTPEEMARMAHRLRTPVQRALLEGIPPRRSLDERLISDGT